MTKSSPARLKAQAKYNKKPSEVKRRVNNNKARRKMIKAGKARVGDGKDVAHKDNNTSNESMMNLLLQSPHKNRSFARTKKAHRKKK